MRSSRKIKEFFFFFFLQRKISKVIEHNFSNVVKLWEHLTQEVTWTKIIATKVRSVKCYLRLQRAVHIFKSSANYF